MKKKIGILTWHYYSNFGSGLQTYALQQLIKDLDYDVKIINYRNPKFGLYSPFKDFIRMIFSNFLGWKIPRFRYAHLRYMYRYLKQTRCVQDETELRILLDNFDKVVCGSDQIWAPNVFNPIYMAAYANDRVEKISYAASIGLRDIPKELIPEYQKYLSRFKAISVREEGGKWLLEEKTGIKTKVVLDPTLMHSADMYRTMERKVKDIKRPYVFCYFLNKDNNYSQQVIQYAQKNNLLIYGYSDKVSDRQWMNRLEGIGADEFLWLVDNASTVFTDSYHATIFSLLFHKNFWTIVRFSNNDPINQNSRLEQLINNFAIGNRVITSDEVIDDTCLLDFEYFEKQVSNLRVDSLKYLKQALS